MQSYWLALQFVPAMKQPRLDFYRGMPQASHQKETVILLICFNINNRFKIV